MDNDELEYRAYLIKTLCQPLDDKTEMEFLTKEEYLTRIEKSK